MFKKVKGFQDIFGEDIPYWHKAETTLKEVAERYCVRELRVPVLEKTEVFDRGIGSSTDIVEKEMFTFTDRDGGLLSMRPEGTAGAVRAFVENGLHAQPGLKKFYYLGPMFRRERPQKGRYRQFTQGGIEYIGSASPLADAEVINLFMDYFKEVGIDEHLRLEINSVGCPSCRPGYHEILKAYFREHLDTLCEDCKRRLDKNPLRILDCKNEGCKLIIKDAPLMRDHLCSDCNDHFAEVEKYLDLMDISFTVNPYIVRGLDYYVRTAFEAITDKLGAASAVGGGGRYDGLVKLMGGADTPGIGFAIGIDRVVALMKETETLEEIRPDYFIITFENTRKYGIRLLNILRKKGRKVEIDHDMAGMKNQMKKADRSGAKYAIILGEDEINLGNVTLKELTSAMGETGKQKEISIEELYKMR